MEPNFLVLLDFSIGLIIKIRLTEEEKKLSEADDDFESFLPVMEQKYGFKTTHCTWMVCKTLEELDYT